MLWNSWHVHCLINAKFEFDCVCYGHHLQTRIILFCLLDIFSNLYGISSAHRLQAIGALTPLLGTICATLAMCGLMCKGTGTHLQHCTVACDAF